MKVIDLNERDMDTYMRIPADIRQRLVSLIKKMEEYSSYTLPEIINQYAYQCDDFPTKNKARCAATGIQLKARGINAPNVWRLNQEDGYEKTNVVIVSAGYANLRRQIKMFGKEAHVYAFEWMREALAYHDLDPSRSIDDYAFNLPEHKEEAVYTAPTNEVESDST